MTSRINEALLITSAKTDDVPARQLVYWLYWEGFWGAAVSSRVCSLVCEAVNCRRRRHQRDGVSEHETEFQGQA